MINYRIEEIYHQINEYSKDVELWFKKHLIDIPTYSVYVMDRTKIIDLQRRGINVFHSPFFLCRIVNQEMQKGTYKFIEDALWYPEEEIISIMRSKIEEDNEKCKIIRKRVCTSSKKKSKKEDERKNCNILVANAYLIQKINKEDGGNMQIKSLLSHELFHILEYSTYPHVEFPQIIREGSAVFVQYLYEKDRNPNNKSWIEKVQESIKQEKTSNIKMLRIYCDGFTLFSQLIPSHITISQKVSMLLNYEIRKEVYKRHISNRSINITF